VLIRSHDTGRRLSPAPDFGQDGSWPRAETEWVPVWWELFEAQTPDPDLRAMTAYALALILEDPPLPADTAILTEDALSADFLYASNFAQVSKVTFDTLFITTRNLKISIADYQQSGQREKSRKYSGENAEIMARKELRRLVHYLRWRRQDPVVQLPPAATNKIRHSVTTGLSVERSQMLAHSLGLEFGKNIAGVQAKLSSELQQQFGLGVEITAQEQRSEELTLANPSDNRKRLFALWHVDHLITVDVLAARQEPPLYRTASDLLAQRGGGSLSLFGPFWPMWVPSGSAEFVTESAPHVTYTEVRRALQWWPLSTRKQPS